MDQSRRSLFLVAGAGLAALLCGRRINAQDVASHRSGKKERVIKIQAKKFVFTPDRIALKKGERVVLELTSLDFVHGFKIPDFNVRADLPPGQVIKIRLNPEKEGIFEYLCDNFCGNGHEEMNGTIVVKA